MKSSNVKSGTPLILPPTAGQFSSFDESRSDNTSHAHSQPYDAIHNKADNPMRELFLQQGILPAAKRPVVSQGHRIEAGSVEFPEADPSGVSNANPEDILDLASMYDPSIHLPDKPNFVSPANRAKYEAGTPLTDELIAYIGVRGPITVAEFMRRVLRDGRYGYYTSKGARSGKKGDVDKSSISDAQPSSIIDDDDDWDLDDDIATSDNGEIGGEQIIGSGGDFITAPEVSQLFGESILVWLITQYQTLGKPSKIQLIEIGPGKGTLICDIIRSAISTFDDFASALTSTDTNKSRVDVGVHLIEVTNGMRARQKESLQILANEKAVTEKKYAFHFLSDDSDEVVVSSDESNDSSASSNNDSKHQNTIAFQWHDVLSSVPTHDTNGSPIPTFIICQELVDALPIHSFQKIEGGAWRERLIDCAIRDDSEAKEAANDVRKIARRYANAEENPATQNTSTAPSSVPGEKTPRLRFVLPPDTTPALRTLLRVNGSGYPLQDNHASQSLDSLPVGSIIEACPEGLILVQDIADRIEKCQGGAALIIDYGEDGASGGDTLRGFWRHTQVHPLSRPGEVDVTADVDFGGLREAVNRRVSLEESLKRKRGVDRHANNDKESELILELESKMGESRNKVVHPEAFGPISQGQFLASMGIVERVEKYIEDDATTDDQAYELYSALERLIGPEQMGERYKVLAIAPKKDGLFPPPGF
jgi:NADH dehydrogenase [ubiquinone] 1 alpha subcomplex assembly factor 7